MRPLFTVHAGEYVVGSYIERNYPHVNLWIPAKDTGVDLLVSDKANKKAVTLQVKYSRDFIATDPKRTGMPGVLGWWTLDRGKIAKSRADYWVFLIVGSATGDHDFIVIKPHELLTRLDAIHGSVGKNGRIQMYLWATKKGKQRACWEARGLTIADQNLIKSWEFVDHARDFTPFLDDWRPLELLGNGSSK
jgi:hypothetical protein